MTQHVEDKSRSREFDKVWRSCRNLNPEEEVVQLLTSPLAKPKKHLGEEKRLNYTPTTRLRKTEQRKSRENARASQFEMQVARTFVLSTPQRRSQTKSSRIESADKDYAVPINSRSLTESENDKEQAAGDDSEQHFSLLGRVSGRVYSNDKKNEILSV